MEGLDVDDVYQHYRLDPTEVEAVTYYLPRLISGETLHGAEKLIYRVDIYGCEPKDLAVRFAPVPQAVSSGDRFFFTTCKSKNGSKIQSVRSAGGGTWTIQKTSEISHAGSKVGEVKNLSFKKKGKSTGWVMEEYRCLLPEATVTDGVKVFCKIHLAQHPPDAARQESAAYKRQEPQPERVTPSTHAQKRPPPAAAADPRPPRPNKRMRVPVPIPAPATPSFIAAASASLPAESIPEADDDMGRFSCSMEELLGVQVEETLPVGADNNIELSSYFEPEELQKLLADVAEEIMGPYLNPTEPEPRPSFVDPFEAAVVEQQPPQAVSTSDKSSMVQDVGSYKPPPILFHPFEAERQAEEAPEKEKRYNAAADLHAPFEAEWQAEEALDKQTVPVEAEENIEQSFYFEPDELQFLLAVIDEATAEQQQAVSTNDKSSMVQDMGTYKPPPIFHPSEAEWQADEALEKADLHAPSLQGHDHLFKSRPSFFDPFEAAWRAEEVLENEKRYNAAANLHAGPLGGHNNFFSSASVH